MYRKLEPVRVKDDIDLPIVEIHQHGGHKQLHHDGNGGQIEDDAHSKQQWCVGLEWTHLLLHNHCHHADQKHQQCLPIFWNHVRLQIFPQFIRQDCFHQLPSAESNRY